MTDPMAAEPPPPAEPSSEPSSEALEERRRSRRSVRSILIVVAAGLVVWAALAVWVLAVPYRTHLFAGAGRIECDPVELPVGRSVSATARSEIEAACDRKADDAREHRRNQALLIGAGVFVVACAVSTWPSRRLTGEALGPLR